MNLHRRILQEFGQDSLALFRELEKTSKALARYANHLRFTLRCLSEGLTPVSLKLRSPINSISANRIIRNTERKLLNERVRQVNFTIDKLQVQFAKQWSELSRSINNEVMTLVNNFIEHAREQEHSRVHARHLTKIERLKSKSTTSSNTTENQEIRKRWVINKSSKQLTDEQQKVLQKGMNFAVYPTSLPVNDFITATEMACQYLGQDQANSLRTSVASTLSSCKLPKPNITKSERSALKELKNDDTLLIISADKGRCTVVMDRKEYDDKAKAMLSDTSTYTPLKKDPTQSIKTKLKGKLKPLKESGAISDRTCKSLVPTAEVPPKFYGLPKIHKPSCPLRPIVSSVGSVTYNLSKHLNDILSPMVGKSEHHILNTEKFVDKLKTLSLEPDEVMISFDVSALFTSVPVNEACQIIHDRLQEDQSLSDRTNMSPAQITDLLQFCLNQTYFSFQGQFYQQSYGTAMGSPVSPTVANLYMENFEKRAISTAAHPPRVWFRYVDDTFVIIKSIYVQEFTDHINSLDDHIKFTREEEQEGKLAFLDVLAIRNENNTIKTQVYRKATHTDQYLNFESNHSLGVKLGVIKTLHHRAETVVSDEADLKLEKQHINQALENNGYPKWSIKIANHKREKQKHHTTDQSRPKPKTYVTFPYIPNVSEKVKRVFNKHNIQAYFKSGNTIRQHMGLPKDKTDKCDRCGVVYKVQCSICSDTYIGETGRKLKTRLTEHRRPSSSGYDSAIYEHQSTRGHQIDWEHVKVIDSESRDLARKVKEAIHIKLHDPKMNRDRGYQLSSCYDAIITKFPVDTQEMAPPDHQ